MRAWAWDLASEGVAEFGNRQREVEQMQVGEEDSEAKKVIERQILSHGTG